MRLTVFFFALLLSAGIVATGFQASRTIVFGSPASATAYDFTLAPGAFENVPVSAESWLIFDVMSDTVIAAERADAVRPIASVTKLMSADVALALLDLSSTTTVSARAVNTFGFAGDLLPGEVLPLRELFLAMMLVSSNDAAEAIAEHFGRNEFIAEMNRRAARIGMHSTRFADPSGLSDTAYSTAADLKILLSHLAREDSYALDVSRLKRFVGKDDRVWQNINPAFGEEGYIGGKHGYTEGARKTLASIFEENFEGEVRPIGIILLKSNDLARDTAALRAEIARSVKYGRSDE